MLPDDPEADLRQGDICALEHLPVWDVLRSAPLGGPLEGHVQMPTWKSIARDSANRCLVVVCSQCCDLENPRGRAGVLIAPLMKVPAKSGDDRHAEIVASIRPDTEGAYHYVNLAPLQLEDGTELVAELSALTTMAPALEAVRKLKDGRIGRLTDDYRREFRIKLAFMLGRDPDRRAE